MKKTPTGLTIRELVEMDKGTLITFEGIILKRAFLPYILPHLVTIVEDYKLESWIGPDCYTSIRLSTPSEINQYITQNAIN